MPVKKTTTTDVTVKPKRATRSSKKIMVIEESIIKPLEEVDIDIVEVKCAAEAMLDKKAQDVCSLNLKNIGTAICDYFIVCNADTRPQVMAIADNVEEMMAKRCNRRVLRMQGKENGFWVILDFANIVVHIFQTEYRQFYRLEDLWGDAEKTTYQDQL